MSHSKATVLSAALSAALMLAPPSRLGQAPQTDTERAEAAQRLRNNAQNFANNARLLTIFDREGRTIRTLGPRDMYNQPAFSPDQSRIAVTKNDLEKQTTDLWVLEVATGEATRMTSQQPREIVRTPVWSADGKQLAYVAFRDGYEGLYRRDSSGRGVEELLYKHPGNGMALTDWSLDGRYLVFYTTQLAESAFFAVPLDGERIPVVLYRSPAQMVGGRVSPDNRLFAYRSNQTGRNEIFVRPFTPGRASGGAEPTSWQVSREGSPGLIFWRVDGTELFFMDAERNLRAAPIRTTPTVEIGVPRILFKLPDAIPVTGTPGGLGNVSRDGQRVVIAVPPMPRLQQMTIFDRQGTMRGTVGSPGLYQGPALSPDGTRVAVVRNDRDAGQFDIWTFDLATGQGTAITRDAHPDFSPVWTRDGRQILYVSTRGVYSGIYRKASNGQGEEELLFRYTAGAGLTPTDISPDGKILVFFSGGIVFVVPLTATDPLLRSALEFRRGDFDAVLGRFSPDARFMAYLSNEDDPDTRDVYVRPFDASSGKAAGENKWKVSSGGANHTVTFRADGREMYWMSVNRLTGSGAMMAVDISTAPSFRAGTPQRLFTLPSADQLGAGTISSDGQRFVFVTDAPSGAPAGAPR